MSSAYANVVLRTPFGRLVAHSRRCAPMTWCVQLSVAHLAPAESPEVVAGLLRKYFLDGKDAR